MAQSKEYRSYLAACRNTVRKAKVRGLTCNLTKDDITELWERCEGKCEVTGIPFDVDQLAIENQRRPWAPSLDRADSMVGYEMENVRVVCVAVNLAMNQWGESVLYKIAVSLLAHGKMNRIAGSFQHPSAMPADVRLYRGNKSLRYLARARDFGEEINLGTYQTIDEALLARKKWALERGSEKVLRQIYDFTKDQNLLSAISDLSLEKATLVD